MMHLLIGVKPGLLSTFFSLAKKRLCSPELKHCLNVYSVVLCTLGHTKNGVFIHSVMGTEKIEQTQLIVSDRSVLIGMDVSTVDLQQIV